MEEWREAKGGWEWERGRKEGWRDGKGKKGKGKEGREGDWDWMDRIGCNSPRAWLAIAGDTCQLTSAFQRAVLSDPPRPLPWLPLKSPCISCIDFFCLSRSCSYFYLDNHHHHSLILQVPYVQ